MQSIDYFVNQATRGIKRIRKELGIISCLESNPMNDLSYIFKKKTIDFLQNFNEELIRKKSPQFLILDLYSLRCKPKRARCYYCNWRIVDGDCPLNLWGKRSFLTSEVIRQILINELLTWAKKTAVNQIFAPAMYFGGNWSFVKDKDLSLILRVIKRNYKLSSQTQITFEIHPHIPSKTIDFFASLKDEFQIRVSLGVQDFNNIILKRINRGHTQEEAIKTIKLLKKKGIITNVDLMVGLPGQSKKTIKESIEILNKLEVESVTIYPLSLVGIDPERIKKLGVVRDKNGKFSFSEPVWDIDEARVFAHYFLTNNQKYPRKHQPLGWYCFEPEKHMPKTLKFQWDSGYVQKLFDLNIGLNSSFCDDYIFQAPKTNQPPFEEIEARVMMVKRKDLPVIGIGRLQPSIKERLLLTNDWRLGKATNWPQEKRLVEKIKRLIQVGALRQERKKIRPTVLGAFLINDLDYWLSVD